MATWQDSKYKTRRGSAYSCYLYHNKKTETIEISIWLYGRKHVYSAHTNQEIAEMVSNMTNRMCHKGDAEQLLNKKIVIRLLELATESNSGLELAINVDEYKFIKDKFK